MRRALVVGLVWAALAPPAGSQTVSPEDVADAVAGLFAGLNALTLTDDLSGSTYVIGDDGPSSDTRVSVFKLPWSRELDVGAARGTLFVQVVAGLLTASETTRFDTPSGRAAIEEDWLSWGLQLGLGWTVPLGRGWAVRPGLSLGCSRVENDGKYDAVAALELEPLLEGVAVNWEAWAFSYGPTLGLLREWTLGASRARLEGRWSHLTTKVFDATSSFQEGRDESSFLALRATWSGDTALELGGRAVGWDFRAGYADLPDSEDALGFDHLWELGGGLVFRPVRALPPLRLGGSWLTGPDVVGWSLALSLAP